MLKERIFGRSDNLRDKVIEHEEFSLEEIMESLVEKQDFLVFSEEEKQEKTIKELDEQVFLLQDKEEKPRHILYEFTEGFYYVYTSQKKEEKPKEKEDEENDFGLFFPTGLIIRRVPQYILGTGVLGRAYIHSNYIEILDRLVGAEYNEVLTHEVLHIMYPEKGEKDIRLMTRNYVGNTIYN